MKQLWTDRNARERRLLAVAGGLLALLLLWQFVLKPVADYRANARLAYERAQARLVTMQRSAGEAMALMAERRGGQAKAAEDVRGAAMASARAKGVTVTRLQPMEDGGVTLWIDGADTRILYDWVVMLERDHGITVIKASLSANDGAATVRAQLQLAGRLHQKDASGA